jgi:hypothetical protein
MERQSHTNWFVFHNRQSMVFDWSGDNYKANLLDAVPNATSLTAGLAGRGLFAVSTPWEWRSRTASTIPPALFLETYMEKKIRQLRSVERPTWYRPYGDEEPFDLGELCHEIAALMERQNDEKVQESVSGELKQ